MRRSGLLSTALVLAGAALPGIPRIRTQESASLPAATSVVKPHAYISVEPVPRGRNFQVAVVAEIARGFHMNSHHPSDEYLIPTTLMADFPAGVVLLDTVYPKGRDERFSFSPDKPLNVYTEGVTLRLFLAAQPEAPLGATTISMELRYQACNDTTCLPPAKIPLSVKVEIARPGARTRALHPEIFFPADPLKK